MKIFMNLDLRSYRKPGSSSKELIKVVLEIHFEAMTKVNMVWLMAHPNAPRIYKSGVRYKNDPIHPNYCRAATEDWSDIPTILKKGHDDCESLSAWLAAEMRVRKIHSIGTGRRPLARVILRQTRKSNLWHAVVFDVQRNRIYDPSKMLGMGSK